MQALADYVAAHLPAPPARVLEVGCGRGDLTRSLDGAGWEVVGIDPGAPPGPLFRRLKLEDLDADDGPFGAVVASRSLHHVADLDLALDRILDLLVAGGTLILDEFAWDRLDQPTAQWYLDRLAEPASLDAFMGHWHDEHVGLHGYTAVRAAVEPRFEEAHFAWTPYLYRVLERPSAVIEEDEQIRAGGIQAIGFRYVGEARPRPAR